MDENTCPHICPITKATTKEQKFQAAGSARTASNPFASPYTPGLVQPPEKKHIPSDAPPQYLPQVTDTTSGDMLGMSPVGPWAAGHIDWTPQAGMTGVRPVVDKYSITRYSTGEWRKNNQFTLTPTATNKAKALDISIQNFKKNAFKTEDEKQAFAHQKLQERTKDLAHWKKKAEKTIKAMADEINTLDEDRSKLKGACRILMLPEAISRECLELRTHRYEPDMVRDDAEQELIKEVAIVGEIRNLFQVTLAKVERQMEQNKSAKSSLEYDWCDKMVTLNVDTQNVAMGSDASLIMFHPGVARWPENATSLEYWKHYCNESIQNCEEVRQKSVELRGLLRSVIQDGSQDMKLQADRTNAALAEKVEATEQMCAKLEETLKDNLQTIVNIENLIDNLKDALRQIDARNKLVMTRLFNRNYNRPSVENCRDEAQYALMDESKYIKETAVALNDKLRDAEIVRMELMKYRGELEKDIACKRKSLNLDEDRLARVRAHMPTPEEFANA
ncbi:unnamed protein product [Arctia plantaginis]|uniref:Tektin n=1 Tax=Arctia plantaginis TaxID=874455 RepID=A0A8S0Z204_ARCPL|nr:unnamed protein product [Arctia plantaginis]